MLTLLVPHSLTWKWINQGTMTEPTPNFFDEQQIEDALKGEV